MTNCNPKIPPHPLHLAGNYRLQRSGTMSPKYDMKIIVKTEEFKYRIGGRKNGGGKFSLSDQYLEKFWQRSDRTSK